MGHENPSGLELLYEQLGEDLSELKEACTETLIAYKQSSTKLVWNPNAADPIMIACLRDIIDEMARVCDNTLAWKDHREFTTTKRKNSLKNSLFSTKKPDQYTALHLICNCDDALNDARIMQTELAMKLGQLVTTVSPDDVALTEANAANRDERRPVAVLLTKNLLQEPATLLELYNASRLGLDMVPVCLIGRGYDYAAASSLLNNLAGGMEANKLAKLVEALEEMRVEGDPELGTLEHLQATVSATLPRIIAVNWEPEGGKNQLEATVISIIGRLKSLMAPTKPKPGDSRRVFPASVYAAGTAVRISPSGTPQESRRRSDQQNPIAALARKAVELQQTTTETTSAVEFSNETAPQ